jgi:hypothetical protein
MGILLASRKRKLRRFQEADHEKARQAQWDIARSRLVF